MKNWYLVLRSIKPYEISFKKDFTKLELVAMYLNMFGDDFLDITQNYSEALAIKQADYELFGDSQPTANLNDIIHLENCLSL